MNFLTPLFFAATSAVALPLLLHLLRRQPRRQVPFPSLRFLGRQALRDSRHQRLRRWLTLFLRCLAILLLAAAFARPFWQYEHSERSRAVVVVVDNSYSMRVEGRRAAIEAWLAPQIATLRRPDQLGVLLLHPTPTWLIPLGDDLDGGRELLKKLPEAFETSHYRAGLELAAAKVALAPADIKQVIVAGDQQRLGWSDVAFDRTLPPGVQLIAAPPATTPERQAAITELKAARLADGRIALDAVVRNFTAQESTRTLSFFADERKLGEMPVTAVAGRPQTIHAEYAISDAQAPLKLHARLDPDALAVDDTAYAALPGKNDQHILLAAPANSEEPDLLRIALSAVRGTEHLAAFRIDTLPTGRTWPQGGVAILRGAAPFREENTAALDAFLAEGGSAWILCNGSPEQAAWLAKQDIHVQALRAMGGQTLKLRDLVLDHPLFAPFAQHSIMPLLTPTFRRVWGLAGSGLEPLARWPEREIAIAEIALGAGRLLITGFGETRDDSSWPIEPGYVPFVHQAATWLVQNQTAPPASTRVGTAIALPGAGKWRAVLTAAPTPPLDVDGSVVPRVPGLYSFTPDDGPETVYAVNLDSIESDLTPWPKPEDFSRLVSLEKPPASHASAPATPAVATTLVDERNLWWWLLLGAIAVLCLELALANRTVA